MTVAFAIWPLVIFGGGKNWCFDMYLKKKFRVRIFFQKLQIFSRLIRFWPRFCTLKASDNSPIERSHNTCKSRRLNHWFFVIFFGKWLGGRAWDKKVVFFCQTKRILQAVASLQSKKWAKYGGKRAFLRQTARHPCSYNDTIPTNYIFSTENSGVK